MEEEIKSPFVKYDYDKLREDTTNVAIKNIFRMLGEKADLLTFSADSTKESIGEEIEILQKEIKNIIKNDKVPFCDLKYLAENIVEGKLKLVFSSLFREIGELEKEYFARCVETRDPGTGKLSKEFMTLEDMFKNLEEIRIKQDTDGNQYFIEK